MCPIHCSGPYVFVSIMYPGVTLHQYLKLPRSFPWLLECTIMYSARLPMMDIWVVFGLQLLGEREDAYLEFQGANGTHLPQCPRVLAVYPTEQRPGRLEDVTARGQVSCTGLR